MCWRQDSALAAVKCAGGRVVYQWQSTPGSKFNLHGYTLPLALPCMCVPGRVLLRGRRAPSRAGAAAVWNDARVCALHHLDFPAGVFLDVSCRGGAVLTTEQARQRYGEAAGEGSAATMPWSEVRMCHIVCCHKPAASIVGRELAAKLSCYFCQ